MTPRGKQPAHAPSSKDCFAIPREASRPAKLAYMPPAPKPTLSSSTSARSPPAHAYFITDGASRRPTAPRASVGSVSLNRPPSSSSTRPTRTAGSPSISSIREVVKDDKVVEELQHKLKEAEASLAAKTDTVTDLEGQIAALNTSLEEARAELAQKTSAVETLEAAKEEIERKLAALQKSFDGSKAQRDADISALETVRAELTATQEANSTQTALVQSLQTQIQTLEEQVRKAQESLEGLRSSSGQASEVAAAAAAAEHEALLKAQADLAALQKETEALKAEHAQTLAETQQKISTLQTQEQELKEKFEDIEVARLEATEDKEKAELALDQLKGEIHNLERSLAKEKTLQEEAKQAAQVREEELLKAATTAAAAHDEELKAAAAKAEELVAQLKAKEDALASVNATLEKAHADAATAAEEHRVTLEDVEKGYQTAQSELSDKIISIRSELEAEESKYNERLAAVKAEHETLLKEAFERAKSEAGAVHSQELQALRSESKATIDQLRAAHQATIDNLNAEHQAALENQVKVLEMQITSQTTEVNAAREDLAKIKAALASVTQELESTKAQLEESRTLISSLDKSDKDETIARLTKELTNERQERESMTEMVKFQNESINDMANNHAKELEAAATTRAEEATKLRAAHKEEIDALTRDRVELSMQLADRENELKTLKANLAADPMTPSKSNGAAHARATSVTKEELQKMHEAHNLTLGDLQAQHDRELRHMKEELERALSTADELNRQVQQKTMEIGYLEKEVEEGNDTITRLTDDVKSLQAKVDPAEQS
ncbi:hypothetical protein NM688_g5577 [Phlebia brevispora]|uniref:Uncharacterized protein n=1 Tax=Phlebia brevispora TaxID=194682 RepID=A0ACC1SSX8_9APHY|nr:hypothetical protein NM688_g5577 [Phlebia brevispora]